MKKITLFLLIVLSIFTFSLVSVSAEALFRIDITSKITTVTHGVKYQKIVGSINYEGTVSNQVIHYLAANPTVDDQIHVVVGDNYWDYSTPAPGGWGMSNINIIADKVESRYENYQVVGGVNGDFYDINNTGKPTEAHIINYDIIYKGTTSTHPVAGFYDDGTTIFSRPTFTGLTLVVQNDEGATKGKIAIDRINDLPDIDGISVYFDNWDAEIPDGYEKLIVKATRTAYDDSLDRYFGRGVLETRIDDAYQVEDHKFSVVCGDTFDDLGLINYGDQLVVQQNVTGEFANTRFGIGVWEKLVEFGTPIDTWTTGAALGSRAPRTAIGVKADGTVFFVVVDGRQFNEGMEGVTHWELAQIMAYFEAEVAYNLDGGGSSTMITADEDDSGYITMNSPSDGRLRSISNAIFFVQGELIPKASDIPNPDTRPQFEPPTNVYLDNGIIHFDEVMDASAYYVSINGVEHYTSTNSYVMPNIRGIYEIKVRTRGTEAYQTSLYSDPYIYYQTSSDVSDILALFDYLAQGRKP